MQEEDRYTKLKREVEQAKKDYQERLLELGIKFGVSNNGKKKRTK
jgi:hypothetical protein